MVECGKMYKYMDAWGLYWKKIKLEWNKWYTYIHNAMTSDLIVLT